MMRAALLTVFGLGKSPIAPGTLGSLPPAIIAFVLVMMSASLPVVNAVIILIGVIFGWACAQFGTAVERETGRKDPSEIVADEVAGQSLPLLFLPWMVASETGAMGWNLTLVLTAFISFRLFDIVKPPPVRNVERIGGGMGILMDDLVAGVYAMIVTHAVAWLILPMIW